MGAKDAPVALLMHGWSGRGLQFREMIAPLLEEGYQVVTFDAPGHGRSTGKESNIILFKDALLKIQQELGFIHLLIAHSLGGAASWYARVEGLEVGKMVSISTPSIPAQIIQEYLVRINASARTGKALEDHVENLVDRSFESFGAYVNAPLAPAIPTLLFHDLKDKEVSIRHLEKLQEVLPHAKSSLSDGLGHNRILKDAGIIRQIVSFARLEKRQTISA
ncbi:alpha/beta fold hydrolase [bacterium SCSIO 12741]|nr:alpha/beta fold hydrolase [bacterium SCSIO 12741]